MLNILSINLTLLFLLNGVFIKGKTQEVYLYTFKISDVNDLVTAKPVTSLLRKNFNTEDDPKQFWPVFDVSLNQYSFRSKLHVNEFNLKNVLSENGYNLIEFKVVCLAIDNNAVSE